MSEQTRPQPVPAGQFAGDELLEVVPANSALRGGAQPVPGARWSPTIGDEFAGLLSRLPLTDEEKRKLKEETYRITSRLPPPASAQAKATGLVVGHIQSGKTLSFTSVAALARDNGYRLVVVIGGTSIPLFEQSLARLQHDLALNERHDRKWRLFINPKDSQLEYIRATLEDWKDSTVPPEARQTVLVAVMKHHKHLAKLDGVLLSLNLRGVPVLVIDDEADHTSLNTRVNQGEMSTTYRRILTLRGHVPQHAYLQYTATPQAPLLINIIDALSPGFAELISPGHKYVGGARLFDEPGNPLVRTIPFIDIPTPDNPMDGPPQSLFYALQLFYLGAAAGLVENSTKNRSMMIHPSQLTVSHAQYAIWVRAAQSQWEQLLKLPPENADRLELVEELTKAYGDLQETVPEIPALAKLLEYMPWAIRRTAILEINAVGGNTPMPDWQGNYAHILVGGQALDRGVTVEGLTVTYMPRGPGVGNADTIQQRARFFGYKEDYLGYCRLYLDAATHQAYGDYVEHENSMRNQLEAHARSGRPLEEWKRGFFLNDDMRPTRANVLDLALARGNYADEWFTPKAPHDSSEAIEANRKTLEAYLRNLSFVKDRGSPERTSQQTHDVSTGVPLKDAFERFLVPFRMTRPRDSNEFTGVLLQIEAFLQVHPEAPCTIYRMSQGAPRVRSLDEEGDEIPTLFQGPHPDKHGAIYPGDSRIRNEAGVTIQYHNITVRTGSQDIQKVPVLAIWVPREMAGAWVTEHQPSQQNRSQ